MLLRHGARAAERASRSERHERLTEEFDDSRNRGQAQPEPDATTEAPRGDQNHPSNSCGALEQQHLRDAASERVADDIDAL